MVYGIASVYDYVNSTAAWASQDEYQTWADDGIYKHRRLVIHHQNRTFLPENNIYQLN